MKKIKRVVLDTNILISAFLLSENSTAARTYYKIEKTGEIVISAEVFQEFSDVFMRSKFDKYLSETKRLKILEDLKFSVKFIAVYNSIQVCRDPKDNKFLELALSANADCIITGDEDLLVLNPFQGIPILRPAEFLERFK
jgi:putative PIN family toxin of toxin-antitoxin system